MLMLCCAGGVCLIVVGLIIGTPTPSVEGAYFDRANGTPRLAGVFYASKPSLLDPADGNLWIGAGVALVVIAVSFTVSRWIRRQRSRALSD
jgi:hypothetical protein